jgi:hypothetical protein
VGAVRARPDEVSSPGSSKTRWQAGRRELPDAGYPYKDHHRHYAQRADAMQLKLHDAAFT